MGTNEVFVAGIQALAQQMSDGSAHDQGIKTLGQVRRALAELPAETPLTIDTGRAPGDVDSYRGYYERLAISSAGGSNATAGEFVKVLDAADGETFEGYKGGSYTMHSGTFLHVAEYGDRGRAVVGVNVTESGAVLVTADEEW